MTQVESWLEKITKEDVQDFMYRNLPDKISFVKEVLDDNYGKYFRVAISDAVKDNSANYMFGQFGYVKTSNDGIKDDFDTFMTKNFKLALNWAAYLNEANIDDVNTSGRTYLQDFEINFDEAITAQRDEEVRQANLAFEDKKFKAAFVADCIAELTNKDCSEM